MLDAPGKPGHVRQLGVAWCQLVSYENHGSRGMEVAWFEWLRWEAETGIYFFFECT